VDASALTAASVSLSALPATVSASDWPPETTASDLEVMPGPKAGDLGHERFDGIQDGIRNDTVQREPLHIGDAARW
jgi:hypothetical protein